MRIRLEHPACNLGTIADNRGAIFNWTMSGTTTIKEFNLIQTNKGDFRGFHYHKEFREWVLIASGQGVYFEYVPLAEQLDRVASGLSQYPFILMGPGDCIFFDIGVPHTLKALTDISAIALLDKKWDDCVEPLTRVDYEPLKMNHEILNEYRKS